MLIILEVSKNLKDKLFFKMEILKLKYTMTKIKTYWMDLVENGSEGVKNQYTEINLSEQQKIFIFYFNKQNLEGLRHKI